MPSAAWNGQRSSRPKRENSRSLRRLLFPPPPAIAADQRPMPDWPGASRATPPQCDPGAASPARSCLSTSPAALARSSKQLARGIANLLNDPVSQQPVPNFRATVSRRSRRMTCRPAAPGSQAQSRQAPPPARCSGSAKGGASRPCGPVRRASLIGRPPKQRAAPANPVGSERPVSNSCCCR